MGHLQIIPITSIMRSLVALCFVLGCSALPVADVTKLSVAQLLGHPVTYAHGIPSFSVPAAVTVTDEESEDSDETTTAIHAVPYAVPHIAAAAAVPVLSTATVESKHLTAVDAAVPADTTKLKITTEEQEVSAIKYVQPTFGNILNFNNFPFSVPAVVTTDEESEDSDETTTAIKYIQPTFGNVLPYSNFPFNNFHYKNFPGYNFYNYQHAPLTYAGASGYPYHFGYPYSFGYTATYAAAPEAEDSSAEEEE